MASRVRKTTEAGDSGSNGHSVFEKMMTRLIHKDEFQEVGKYRIGQKIEQHLAKLEKKYEELEIEENDKIKYLLASLDEDMVCQICSQIDYEENQNSYSWIKEKLMRICNENKSRVSGLVQFLYIKQELGQSLHDFAKAVRIEGYKLLRLETPKKREEYFVMAFTNGLRDKKCKLALRQINPQTLDEAVKLIKREPLTMEYPEQVRALDESDKMTILERKIDELCAELRVVKDKLTRLCPEFNSPVRYSDAVKRNLAAPPVAPQIYRRSDPPRLMDGRQNEQQTLRCYNCSANGHIARQCPHPVVCRKCNGVGHWARDCHRAAHADHRQGRPIRQVFDNESEPATIELEEYDAEESKEISNATVAAIQPELPHGNPSTRVKRTITYPPEVEEWNRYIYNNGPKPKQTITRAKTMISRTCNEHAENKPVAVCRIAAINKSVLFDTGSVSNVIDNEFFENVRRNNQASVKLMKKSGSLRCANGSPIRIIGYTMLNVTIGTKVCRAKFTVVDRISPHVIFGIRGMKKFNISMLPARDGLEVQGEFVKFLSSINEEN